MIWFVMNTYRGAEPWPGCCAETAQQASCFALAAPTALAWCLAASTRAWAARTWSLSWQGDVSCRQRGAARPPTWPHHTYNTSQLYCMQKWFQTLDHNYDSFNSPVSKTKTKRNQFYFWGTVCRNSAFYKVLSKVNNIYGTYINNPVSLNYTM